MFLIIHTSQIFIAFLFIDLLVILPLGPRA